jgi:hypothetical protein
MLLLTVRRSCCLLINSHAAAEATELLQDVLANQPVLSVCVCSCVLQTAAPVMPSVVSGTEASHCHGVPGGYSNDVILQGTSRAPVLTIFV